MLQDWLEGHIGDIWLKNSNSNRKTELWIIKYKMTLSFSKTLIIYAEIDYEVYPTIIELPS